MHLCHLDSVQGVADVCVDGKLGQQAVTEVDLVILAHVDRRTELRVEAVG